MIRAVLIGAGFQINHRKVQLLDFAKGAIVLNGIGITPDKRMFMPRHALRRLAGVLHRAIAKGDVDLNRIHGMMATMHAVTSGTSKCESKVWDMYQTYREKLKAERERRNELN